MNSLERFRVSSILSLLGGSLELSIALPEAFRPPNEWDAAILILSSLISIFCGIMLYSTPKLRNLWAVLATVMALLVIIVVSPLEGFGFLGPPMVLTSGILAILDQMSTSGQSS